MTHAIFGAVAPTDPSHIVVFRTSGANAPLFCFPGSGGNAHVFREMAEALPEGRPVYAIDMERLCDLKQDFTIEQVAEYYLEVIRTIQPSGPYYFCGYSFGGLVAYEISRRLMDEGDSAAMVALLDAPNPALVSNLSEVESIQFHKTYLIDRLKGYGLQLVRGELKAFVGRALAFVTSRGGRFVWPLIKTVFQVMHRPLPGILRANDPGFSKAEGNYVPKRSRQNLVCFRVEERGPEHDRDPSMGWDSCAMGGVEVHVVPGGHAEMMSMPNVRAVADVLARHLGSARVAERTA